MPALDLDLYQLKTRLHALYSLYNLSQSEVDAFLQAYILFERDWTTYDDGRCEETWSTTTR